MSRDVLRDAWDPPCFEVWVGCTPRATASCDAVDGRREPELGIGRVGARCGGRRRERVSSASGQACCAGRGPCSRPEETRKAISSAGESGDTAARYPAMERRADCLPCNGRRGRAREAAGLPRREASRGDRERPRGNRPPAPRGPGRHRALARRRGEAPHGDGQPPTPRWRARPPTRQRSTPKVRSTAGARGPHRASSDDGHSRGGGSTSAAGLSTRVLPAKAGSCR